jgi:hypothetical protein
MPKPIDTYGHPDPRWDNHVVVDSKEPFHFHFSGVEDLYQQTEKFKLHDTVPQKVRAQFDLALNLYLYHWFVYDFVTVAEQQAYSAMEAALKHRYREDLGDSTAKATLAPLLDYALKKGWLNAADYQLPFEGTPTGSISLLDIIRRLRNDLAHGDFHLMQAGSYNSLEWCHDIINVLFPDKEGSTA